MNRPAWGEQWVPGQSGQRRPLVFGADDPGSADVVRLAGGYAPPFPQDLAGSPHGSLPRIEVVEPNVGWWTQAGAFGFRYQGPVPSLAGGTIPLTEQIRLPGPPRLWWIHWFRYSRSIFDEASPNYGVWDLRGRVTYGVGGAQNIVECDVAAGIQMSVVCNSIKVDLVTYAPYVNSFDEEPYTPGDVGVVAGAMFGDGSAAGALPPTWSSQTLQAAGLTGIMDRVVAVPDFARSVCLHTNVTDPALLANSVMAFESLSFGQGKVINLQTVYQQLSTERGIAIPAFTNQIRIVTAAPAAPGAYYTLQFFLAL